MDSYRQFAPWPQWGCLHVLNYMSMPMHCSRDTIPENDIATHLSLVCCLTKRRYTMAVLYARIEISHFAEISLWKYHYALCSSLMCALCRPHLLVTGTSARAFC